MTTPAPDDVAHWSRATERSNRFTLGLMAWIALRMGRGVARLLAGLRAIAQVHTGDFRITPNQNLIVAGIAADARPEIERLALESSVEVARARCLPSATATWASLWSGVRPRSGRV